MRKAREFWASFDPQSFDEYMGVMFGPNGGYIRMVLSYWDMAASLVENGAIDRKMFYDANQEFLMVFSKMEPILGDIRAKFGNPGFLEQFEKLTMGLPDARTQIDTMKMRIRSMIEARAAAQQAAG